MTFQQLIAVTIGLAAAPVLAQQQTSQHPRIGQLAELRFAHASATLLPGTEQELGQIAAWAQDNPDAHVVLDGYADRSGNRSANVKLSLRRAQSVRESLISLGVDSDQIVIAAYGESGPRSPNSRRVVVWGTRAGLDAIVARSTARGKPLIWTGHTTVATR
jgi:outer membrane protein OmpA-like peptidoglycan-associated protein